MSAQHQLDLLRAGITDLLSKHSAAALFVAQVRGYEQLLGALPEKYARVYHDTLDRLESGALFSEESCSFSQRDLLDHLQLWCDKAQIVLAQSEPSA